MEMQYFKEYSPALGREMECKVYGHMEVQDNLSTGVYWEITKVTLLSS